jgi:hypothetical protein
MSGQGSVGLTGPAGPADPVGPADRVDPAGDARACIERCIRAIAAGYVDAARGLRIAGEIGERLARGEYEDFEDPASHPAALAERLSTDLYAASGDLHLRVVHRPPPTEGQDPAADRQARVVAENFGIARLEHSPEGIGLLALRYLAPANLAGAPISAALSELADCKALILDLRANRGGDPGLIALICTHFFDAEAAPRHLNDMHFRDGSVQQWWTLPWLPGPRLGLGPTLLVLIGPRTFSGGEELACNLQSLGRARLLGEPTAGAGHPTAPHAMGGGFTLRLPYARSINPHSGQSWEGRGLIPDIAVPAEDAEPLAFALARAAIAGAA